MDSRKRYSCFHWFPTDFFKGLTCNMLCFVAYVHLGISISSYFNFMLFSFSFVIFFANPLVRLGPHSSCIVRLAFIKKNRKYKNYCPFGVIFRDSYQIDFDSQKVKKLKSFFSTSKGLLVNTHIYLLLSGF